MTSSHSVMGIEVMSVRLLVYLYELVFVYYFSKSKFMIHYVIFIH